MGEPAHDRANKNNPVLSFRCPSPDFKERIKREAEAKGMSVQKYLLHAIESHMDGPALPPVKASTAKRHADKVKDDLSSALDVFDDFELGM